MTFDQVAGLQTGMLAFARSLQLSEALLWGEKADGTRVPIEVFEKGVRGQTSSASSQASEVDPNEGKSNPQMVDGAIVPLGAESFVISVRLRVLGAAMAPHACDNLGVSQNFRFLARAYADQGGFSVLAQRYITNILNGRFAWRNRYQTDRALVRLSLNGLRIVSNPLALPLSRMPDVEELNAALVEGTSDDLNKMIRTFEAGLTGTPCLFDIEWVAQQCPGDEVFPSQEYLRGDSNGKGKAKNDSGKKSRVYASLRHSFKGVTIDHASIHSQKVGAALRHIDDWHGDAKHGPIAVNPFGGVQETGAVLRHSTSKTAKSLEKIMAKPALLLGDLEKPAPQMSGDTHFFFANLVRGGVYGVAPPGKKGKAKAKDASEQAEVEGLDE